MLTTLQSLASYLMGEADAFLFALLALTVIDYLTGITAAALNGKLCPAVGYKGIVKKVLMLVLVMVATILDDLYGMNSVLRKAVVTALLINEGVSILSNLKECGVDIPSLLPAFLASAKSQNDSKEISPAEKAVRQNQGQGE